jgi:MFS superfamily sulfate permease-like transporter
MDTDDGDPERVGVPPGGNGDAASGTGDLIGLFAPPLHSPPRQALRPSLFTPPSETDPLLRSSSFVKVGDGGGTGVASGRDSTVKIGTAKNPNRTTELEDEDEVDELSSTVRRTNSINEIDNQRLMRSKSPGGEENPSTNSVFSGRDFFLKTAAASPQNQRQLLTSEVTSPEDFPLASPTPRSSTKHPLLAPFGSPSTWMSGLRAILDPLRSPSTWTGGILFVLYHVVFCMACGGSITRPYSGESIGLLGDMVRYTALGIFVSCPFLVWALSDRHHKTGIPAMYPSLDTFLPPFLAEAAAVVDKTIVEDWKAGLIDVLPSDQTNELLMNRLWFGSYAVVISFGMFAAGSLLILASKIKLANLGTYLPYGVLCGFFSSVGILMWKLAITIDTPSHYEHWTDLLLHHLPGFVVGIAMNRLGPKHPFFVTGLLIFTVVVFYVVMMIMGISLDEARSGGWFYKHEELQSSSSIPREEGMGVIENEDSWWNPIFPPNPFGTWVAIISQCVHWRAVYQGAEHMVALAILYLLRASIHAAALKKNTPNLVRRIPIESTPKTTNDNEKGITTKDIEISFVGGLPSSPRHRRNHSASSASSGFRQLAQSVREEVRIVNLSLTDRQDLKGKCYTSPYPRTMTARNNSISSTTTDVTKNAIRSRNNKKNQQKDGEISVRGIPTSPIVAPPVPLRSPLKPYNVFGNNNGSDGDHLLLPTVRREVSTLTQRTSSTRENSFSHEKNTFPLEGSSVGGSAGGDGSTTKYGVDYVEIRATPTDLTVEEIFAKYAYGMFVTGVCGGFGCVPTVATSFTMYAIGAGKPAPQYFSIVLLLVAFYTSGFELVRFIPKAAFSSLLVLSAADNILNWFIKPISKMDNLLEWSVVPFIAMLSLLVGFLNAVVLGIGLSTFLFVTEFFRVGVVKYDASGLEIRSRIERSLVQSVWLDTHGDDLRVLVLQNYLFFGNATSVLRYIETMFDEIPLVESIRLAYPIPPVPVVLILDLSLITGMDTSAVDAFMDILRICKTNNCKLYLCGLSPRLKKTFAKGGMRPDTKGPRKSRTLLYFSDLDHGLGRAEDVLIDQKMGDFADQSLFQLKAGSSGFHVALQHIDQLHSTNMADGLLELEPHTHIVTLEAGQILYEKDGGLILEKDHGLFFIESGMIREDDGRSNRTNTRTGGSSKYLNFGKANDNTLRGKHARLDTAAQRAALTKLAGGETNNLRIATAGPGW